MEFLRKEKGSRPVVAICYDFDKTLSPDDMQSQGLIQDLGLSIEDFWRLSNALADENAMDRNLAYMYQILKHGRFTRDIFASYGSRVSFFPGVTDWFGRIRAYGHALGLTVEHYIISSGLEEMIAGSSIAHEFEKIYASSFFYDEKGYACWPAQAINYTGKTQFLFRIEKGCLDSNDPFVNVHLPSDKLRVPFRNFLYIGDSDTDIPCMRLITKNGGHSIGVYDPQTEDKSKVYAMHRQERIRYFVPADYRPSSPLDQLVKQILTQTAAFEQLEQQAIQNAKESAQALSSPTP